VLGHIDIKGNDAADKLAKLGHECMLAVPEQACDISTGSAQKAVRDWTKRHHKNTVIP
jgi:hypothetical protein